MAEIPQGALIDLLLEDGILIRGAGGSERTIHCFNPQHDDSSPSMSVNITKGVYHCFGCGIKGNAYTYLTSIRRWNKKDAIAKLKEKGWSEDRIDLVEKEEKKEERRKAGLPKHVDAPYSSLSKNSRAIANHDYRAADGELICRVVRYTKDTTNKKQPKVLPFTPAKRGGWWVCGPMNQSLPKEDRRADKYPLYRLPDMVAMLKKQTRQIYLVEGERCVDAVLGVKGEGSPKSGPPPCTCLFGGSKKSFDKVDLSPLFGNKILLMADTDEVSRNYMKNLGTYLHRHGCAVKYLLPPGEGGYDVSDAINDGGWPAVIEWAQQIGVTTHDPRPQAQIAAPPSTDSPHYLILGVSGDDVVVQFKDTYHITNIPESHVASGNTAVLLRLAPLTYWLEQCDEKGLSNAARISFGSSIVRAARKKGEFSSIRVIGRGATRHNGNIYYNLGDRLLALDEDSGLMEEERSLASVDGAIFGSGVSVKLQDHTDAAQYGKDLYDAVMRYRWIDYHHGRAFLGWLVCSLVSGILPFRPMVWLNAPAGTGKTYLFENVVGPVLGETLVEAASASEPSVAYAIKSDALPLYLDEFEPKKGKISEERFNAVLDLIRIATSGSGLRIRAQPGRGQGVSSVHPRFSALIASISRPRLDMANRSRFYLIQLSRQRVEKWAELVNELHRVTHPDRMLALRTRIIRHSAIIADKVDEFRDFYDEKLDDRQLLLLSALTAGAGFLSDDYSLLPSQIVDSDEQAGKYDPLMALLGRLVRAGKSEATIMECLVRSTYGSINEDFGEYEKTSEDKLLAEVAARHGFAINYTDVEKDGISLYVAYGERNLKEALRGTDFDNLDIESYLLALPGVERERTSSGRAKRVVVGSSQKPVLTIPHAILEEVGMIPHQAPKDPRKIFTRTIDSADYY